MVVTQRVPSSCADDQLRHDDVAAVGARERQRAEGDRPAAGRPTSSSTSIAASASAASSSGQPGRDATPGQAGAVLLEQEAVGAGDGEQVDVGVEPDGAGDHRRVPVRSWAMPAGEQRALRVGEARGAEQATSSSGSGR